jgi:serine/threonine protein kinase
LIKTGENVRDGQGNSYQLGQLLGRGLWGKSYVVRRESDESQYVLKTPLAPEDFRGEIPGADAFFAACREALLEQARLYELGQHPFLPRIESRFTLPDGQPAIVIPRFPETLERRMAEGLPTGALIEILLGVAKHLRALGADPGQHGGLRPSNVLFNDRGEIFLSDLATVGVRRNFARLASVVPGGQPYLPPELSDAPLVAGAVGNGWGAGVDTYSLAMMLWRGLVTAQPAPPWPRAGLDKAAQVALKDHVVERMKLEDSNPRFHGRLAERVAVLLSRAISRETNPSPPYRFPRLDELQARLDEIQQLIRPQVSSVGKVLLDRTAAKPWFTTDEDITFTTTVGTSAGVEGQEEIGVGMAMFELDRDLRVKDLSLGYSVDRHPSGRYRFSFTVGGLGPGRYRARLAFAIRDSGQPPVTSEAEFNVRAAPGWVPRAEPPVASPLPLRPEPITVTQQAPRAEIVSGGVALPGAPLTTGHAAAALSAGPGPRVAPFNGAAAVPEPEHTEALPTRGTPPPYTPGPKPPAPTRTDRHGFDDPSITAVPVSGVQSPPAPLPLPIPPSDRTAPMIEAPRLSIPAAHVAPVEVENTYDDEEMDLLPEPGPSGPAVGVPFQVPATYAAPERAYDPRPVVSVRPVPLPPPEPVYKPRDWSQEALPGANASRNLDTEEEPPNPFADEDAEPSPLSRVWHQLRNDPYIAVMAGLGVIILVLLLVFLLLRK